MFSGLPFHFNDTWSILWCASISLRMHMSRLTVSFLMCHLSLRVHISQLLVSLLMCHNITESAYEPFISVFSGAISRIPFIRQHFSWCAISLRAHKIHLSDVFLICQFIESVRVQGIHYCCCTVYTAIWVMPSPPPPPHLSAFFLMCHFTESTQDPFVRRFSHVPVYRECACARNSLLLLHCLHSYMSNAVPSPPPPHLSASFLMCHFTEGAQDPFVRRFSHMPVYRECACARNSLLLSLHCVYTAIE